MDENKSTSENKLAKKTTDRDDEGGTQAFDAIPRTFARRVARLIRRHRTPAIAAVAYAIANSPHNTAMQGFHMIPYDDLLDDTGLKRSQIKEALDIFNEENFIHSEIVTEHVTKERVVIAHSIGMVFSNPQQHTVRRINFVIGQIPKVRFSSLWFDWVRDFREAVLSQHGPKSNEYRMICQSFTVHGLETCNRCEGGQRCSETCEGGNCVAILDALRPDNAPQLDGALLHPDIARKQIRAYIGNSKRLLEDLSLDPDHDVFVCSKTMEPRLRIRQSLEDEIAEELDERHDERHEGEKRDKGSHACHGKCGGHSGSDGGSGFRDEMYAAMRQQIINDLREAFGVDPAIVNKTPIEHNENVDYIYTNKVDDNDIQVRNEVKNLEETTDKKDPDRDKEKEKTEYRQTSPSEAPADTPRNSYGKTGGGKESNEGRNAEGVSGGNPSQENPSQESPSQENPSQENPSREETQGIEEKKKPGASDSETQGANDPPVSKPAKQKRTTKKRGKRKPRVDEERLTEITKEEVDAINSRYPKSRREPIPPEKVGEFVDSYFPGQERESLPLNVRLCRMFAKHLIYTDPKSRPKYLTEVSVQRSWHSEMDLLMAKDGRTDDEIAEMIHFIMQHKFWKKNVLSPAKLRAQYDNLDRIKNISGEQEHEDEEEKRKRDLRRQMGRQEHNQRVYR